MRKSRTFGATPNLEPVEPNGVPGEHSFFVSWCVSTHQRKGHVQPISIRCAQRHHRPITAPHDPVDAKTAEYVRDEGVQRCRTCAYFCLRKQSGQLAVDGCSASELLNLTGPGVVATPGNIGFAGMV
jgi:hypothetical protein